MGEVTELGGPFRVGGRDEADALALSQGQQAVGVSLAQPRGELGAGLRVRQELIERPGRPDGRDGVRHLPVTRLQCVAQPHPGEALLLRAHEASSMAVMATGQLERSASAVRTSATSGRSRPARSATDSATRCTRVSPRRVSFPPAMASSRSR